MKYTSKISGTISAGRGLFDAAAMVTGFINPDTYETMEKTVVETYTRKTPYLVHLAINEECLTTTAGLPFYVQNKGFEKADRRQTRRLKLRNLHS